MYALVMLPVELEAAILHHAMGIKYIYLCYCTLQIFNVKMRGVYTKETTYLLCSEAEWKCVSRKATWIGFKETRCADSR
jgi:hypothetical protein